MENERERGKGEQRQQFSSVYTKIQTKTRPANPAKPTEPTNQPPTHHLHPNPKTGVQTTRPGGVLINANANANAENLYRA